MIEALVFDFDGLILDTETPILLAWQEAFDAHGCTLTIDDWANEIGTAGAVNLVALLQSRATVEVDVDTMHAQRRARCDELLAIEAVRAGVIDWLDDAAARGLPVAIASSSPPEWVHGHLDRLVLRPHFDAIACRDGKLAPKPAPDTYLAACAAIGVAPEHALAIEDSPHGITAAKRAGLRCVAVPNAVTSQLDLSHADLQIDSLAAVSLGDVLGRLLDV